MAKNHPAAVQAMLALEKTKALDGAVKALQPLADRLISDPARRRVLQGHDMGHALHPPLTDLPVGLWLSTAVLDLTGGRHTRAAATRLVGLGILTAVPTAVTGWAEWAVAGRATQRVGVVHAAANSVALVLYTGSWLARRRNHHRLGVALSTVAGAGLLVGGALGGHMAIGQSAGTRHPAFARAS